MVTLIRLSIILFLVMLCLHYSDLSPPHRRPRPTPFRAATRLHHEPHHYSKKGKRLSNKHHGHHVRDSKSNSWDQQDSGSHGREADDVKSKDKGAHWNNFGETETVVKDKGHGYVKAFSWDREEIKKDKWGKSGAKYDKGYEKKKHKDTADHKKQSAGHEKSDNEHKSKDQFKWIADDAADVYAGLTLQDIAGLQELM